MINELWADVPGYNGNIQISNLGRLRRFKKYWSIYENTLDTNGYFIVSSSYKGKRFCFKIHILVALCFIGERPVNQDVHHKDEIKTNNHWSNLEYLTKEKHYETLKKVFFTQVQIDNIKQMAANGIRHIDIADVYNGSKSTIQCLVAETKNFLPLSRN